jgi:hypothetical protein
VGPPGHAVTFPRRARIKAGRRTRVSDPGRPHAVRSPDRSMGAQTCTK